MVKVWQLFDIIKEGKKEWAPTPRRSSRAEASQSCTLKILAWSQRVYSFSPLFVSPVCLSEISLSLSLHHVRIFFTLIHFFFIRARFTLILFFFFHLPFISTRIFPHLCACFPPGPLARRTGSLRVWTVVPRWSYRWWGTGTPPPVPPPSGREGGQPQWCGASQGATVVVVRELVVVRERWW